MRIAFGFVIPLFLYLAVASSEARITVAIADFTNQTDRFRLDRWEEAVPQLLKSGLSDNDNITIVERQELQRILEEQALSMTGLTDTSAAQQIGGLIGAEYIITGIILQDEQWTRIDASIIKVTTGVVKNESVRSTGEGHLDVMTGMLANNIINLLLGSGERQESLSLGTCPTTVFAVSSVVLGIGTLVANNTYQGYLDDYNNAGRLDEFDEAYDRAGQWDTTRKILAGVTAAAVIGTLYCWIRNSRADRIYADMNNSGFDWSPYVATTGMDTYYAGIAITF